MGRKKKKEEPTVYHTPFGSTTMRPPEYDLSPYSIEPDTIEVTSLGDPYKSYIQSPFITDTSLTYTGSTGEIRHVYYPSKHWEPYLTTLDYEDFMKKIGKEEETKVNVISKKSEKDNEYIVFCKDILDLSTERILTTLSATKGRLMFDIAPIHVKEVECKMTPSVKKNIIEASKKLKMYGKKTPIIPSFDEYGNRLPDQLEIGDDRGITVKIVDPEEYGECYLELKATEFPTGDYVYKSAFDDMLLGEDSPF